jgi:hypothetical protein
LVEEDLEAAASVEVDLGALVVEAAAAAARVEDGKVLYGQRIAI